MKLTLCFLALFLTFASCETAFRPFQSFPSGHQDLPEGPHKDVAEFFEGLFSRFGLDKPKQIIWECFCDKSAAIYLEILRTWNQVLIDVNARDVHHVHLDFAKEFILSILDHSSSGCIIASQDFSNLLKAAGVQRDPILTEISGWLYYQAYFPKFLEEYKPVIQSLDSKNFSAAGAAYGDIFQDNVDAVKNEGVHYLSHVGLQNGFALGLDIDLPNDSLTVWNDTTAAYDLEFAYEAAKAVADGHWCESYENLVKFWEEKGKDLMEHIPASVWECLQGSDDNKKVTEKLGVDVVSKEFGELAAKWIKKHPWKYHSYAKLVKKNFEQLHFLHVGALKGHLVKEIAKSK